MVLMLGFSKFWKLSAATKALYFANCSQRLSTESSHDMISSCLGGTILSYETIIDSSYLGQRRSLFKRLDLEHHGFSLQK